MALSVLSSDQQSIILHQISYCITFASVACRPPRSPLRDSCPYQQMSTLDNSHVLSLLVLSLFSEEDLRRRPVNLHISVSG